MFYKTRSVRSLGSGEESSTLPKGRDFTDSFFSKIAGFLNSRSLIYASSDPEDFLALPKEQFRDVLKMAKLFWDLWTKLSLPSLVTRKKWQSAHENLAVGDVDLLLDPNQPCVLWKIGHVNQVYPGGDGPNAD